MAASKFSFQNLNKQDPNYVNVGGEDYGNDFWWESSPSAFPSRTQPKGDKPAGFALPGTTQPKPATTTSPQKTPGQGGFDFSMFSKWGGDSSRSGGSAGQSMFGGRVNQPTQYKPPTGSVNVASTQVIKPSGPMPTLAPGTPFAAPEKTDIEPVRRKEMGSSYRRLSQVVAQALAGIGDEDVMGTQKREVLEGFGNTLSDAQQGAYRVARSEGAREDVRKMTEAQANWQAGEQTRMTNFNALLQDYFKQYTTQTTSAKKYTYDVKGPDEKEEFGFGMGVSSLPSGSRAPAVNLGNIVNRYFG